MNSQLGVKSVQLSVKLFSVNNQLSVKSVSVNWQLSVKLSRVRSVSSRFYDRSTQFKHPY